MIKDFLKKNFLLIGIIIILGIVIFYLLYLNGSYEKKIGKLEEEISFLKSIPLPSKILTPEEAGTGKVGEIEGPEKEKVVPLPSSVFNTSGKIKEIKESKVIIFGSGSNFADQKQRELTLLFTLETITFEPGQKKSYQGLEGLKHLKEGMQILVEGDENIRGKTEFKVKTINILK